MGNAPDQRGTVRKLSRDGLEFRSDAEWRVWAVDRVLASINAELPPAEVTRRANALIAYVRDGVGDTTRG
jgi:hypothetical protein